MKKTTEKFEFNTDFQWEIIKYTVTEPKGYKALLLYQYSYFDLLNQQIIVRSIDRYFKRRNRVPSKAPILLEEVKYYFSHKDYVNTLKERDREIINKKIRLLYKSGVKDAEEIIQQIVNFASYVDFKNVISGFDISNYEGYPQIVNKLQNAVNKKKELETNRGSFMAAGIRGRAARRKHEDNIVQTPFKQLNYTTNAGGYPRNSVIVLMDKEKGGKTLSLVNIARGYIRLRKKVCIIDLENGQVAYEDRVDQSVAGITKKELKAKEQDLKKMWRKYTRLGSDIYIERLPAKSTFAQVDKVFEELKEDFGWIPNILIIDYLILMSPTKVKGKEHEDISEVYVEAKNFAEKWDLEILWTANHIKREAYKRRATRYDSGDAAKALDIGRHADAIIGINQNKDEEKLGIIRWEIVDQRDGIKGPIFFNVKWAQQRLEEFTKEAVKGYREKYYNANAEDITPMEKKEVSDL